MSDPISSTNSLGSSSVSITSSRLAESTESHSLCESVQPTSKSSTGSQPSGFSTSSTSRHPSHSSVKEWASGELRGRTFEFETLPSSWALTISSEAVEVAVQRIQERSVYKPADKTLSSENYYFLSNENDERASYPGVAEFWNDTVSSYRSAARATSDCGHMWVYDVGVKDGGVEGKQLKPALVILHLPERVIGCQQSLEKDQRFSWDKISVVCEVKANWTDVIEKATTYAKCLFCAHPSRSFVVVVGFCFTDLTFRFLFFHRSGLTSSPIMPIMNKKPQGRGYEYEWSYGGLLQFASWAACVDELQSGGIPWMADLDSTPPLPVYAQPPILSSLPPSPTDGFQEIFVRPSVSGRATRITQLRVCRKN